MRKRITISYERPEEGPDLEETLKELKILRGTRYSGRSIADIGGIILSEHAARELLKLRGGTITT